MAGSVSYNAISVMLLSLLGSVLESIVAAYKRASTAVSVPLSAIGRIGKSIVRSEVVILPGNVPGAVPRVYLKAS